MSRPTRSKRRAAAPLLLTVAALLLLLEATARLYLFGLAGLVPARINSVHGLPSTGFTRPSPHPELVYELAPDVDGYFKLASFRTNSRGLRDREYAPRKPKGAFRVAVLGSSFALPAGVPIEEAFHSRLEDQLSRERGPGSAEFLNFAVGAYTPKQVLAMLELRALAYAPDLVLVAVTELALPQLVAPYADPVPHLDPRIGLGERTHPFFQSFLWQLAELRLDLERPPPGVPRVGLLERAARRLRGAPDSAAPAPPPAARRLEAGGRPRSVLQRLAEIRERTGIPVVVVRLAFDPQPPSALDVQAATRARELGLGYVDTRGAFEGTRPSDFWIYELDPHPNGEAHAIFARVVGDYLHSHGLVPR